MPVGGYVRAIGGGFTGRTRHETNHSRGSPGTKIVRKDPPLANTWAPTAKWSPYYGVCCRNSVTIVPVAKMCPPTRSGRHMQALRGRGQGLLATRDFFLCRERQCQGNAILRSLPTLASVRIRTDSVL